MKEVKLPNVEIAKHILGQRSKFITWDLQRQYISKAIDRKGTIFDPACGSCSLFWYLEKWSGHSLIPFGCDIEKDYIELAKQIYPQYRNNFTIGDFSDIHINEKFDYVYFSIFTEFKVDESKSIEWINKLSLMFSHRFIITSYGDLSKKEFYKRIDRIKELLSMQVYDIKGIKHPNHFGVYFESL